MLLIVFLLRKGLKWQNGQKDRNDPDLNPSECICTIGLDDLRTRGCPSRVEHLQRVQQTPVEKNNYYLCPERFFSNFQ